MVTLCYCVSVCISLKMTVEFLEILKLPLWSIFPDCVVSVWGGLVALLIPSPHIYSILGPWAPFRPPPHLHIVITHLRWAIALPLFGSRPELRTKVELYKILQGCGSGSTWIAFLSGSGFDSRRGKLKKKRKNALKLLIIVIFI